MTEKKGRENNKSKVKKTKEEIRKEKLENRKATAFLLHYVKKNGAQVLMGIFVLTIVDLVQLVIPRIVKQTLDILGQENFDENIILKYFIYILLLAFSMVILRFFWRLGIIGASRKIEKQVREDMFDKIQTLSFSYFNKTKTGDLMALLINDVTAIRMATGPSFIALTDAIFMGTMTLVFMLTLAPKISLLSIVPLPLIALISLKITPIIRKKFTQVQESFSSISSHTQETFSGSRIVKGFVQEKPEIDNFVLRCNDYVDKNLKLVRIWGLFFPTITFLASISVAFLYFFGGKGVMLNQISLGTLVALSMYLGQLVWPMMAIGMVTNRFQRGLASGKRILDLIEEIPEVKDTDKTNYSITKIEGAVKIKNLSFSYNKNSVNVLENINLEIPEGSSLGIMGKPGSGKSTLISLLFHLFEIKDDRIFLDGTDINTIPMDILRKSIGYVPQDSFLFSETIAGNIAFGLDEGFNDRGLIEKYAKTACVHEDIMGFSKNYETSIGERGLTLSGGQKQRIAIARALMINPRILILDDALSAVDASTEKEILRNLKTEIKKRTSIIIAHRVSTIKDCDRIIVLDEGRITEQGKHEELIALDGYYAKLYNLQKLEESFMDE